MVYRFLTFWFLRAGDRKKTEITNMVQIPYPSATKNAFNTSLISLREHINGLLSLLDGLEGISKLNMSIDSNTLRGQYLV